MSRYRDDRDETADDACKEQGRVGGRPADERPDRRGGQPTGEQQAAANRELDPPA